MPCFAIVVPNFAFAMPYITDVMPDSGIVEHHIAIVEHDGGTVEHGNAGYRHYIGNVISGSGGVERDSSTVVIARASLKAKPSLNHPIDQIKKAFQSPSPDPKGFLFGKSKLMYYNGMFPCFLAGFVRILV